MDRRFEARLREMLDDAQAQSDAIRELLPRLESFLEPFVETLSTDTQQAKARQYVTGMLSDLKHKNVESVAYLYDRDRQTLQKFIGQLTWVHQPMQQELAKQVGKVLGEHDGVLVFDPSAFPKKGTKSVGVQRQWCGRLGKVENCQVGVYLGYASRKEHALVDFRLYLPKSWTQEKKRCREAGVPRSVRFQTRHALALEMLDENGASVPHGWISGDDEMGRSTAFRRDLRDRDEAYVLAVPSNTLIRDLELPAPTSSGRGRRRQRPFERVDQWCASLPHEAWTEIEVRPGEKGPITVEAVMRRVQAKTEDRCVGPEETLVVFRERESDGSLKHDYTLSWSEFGASLAEYARVFKCQQRIEECLQRAKGEAGLADYEVRTWQGWHHHQMLSLLAVWFLTCESQWQKKIHPGDDRIPGAVGDGNVAGEKAGKFRSGDDLPDDNLSPATHSAGSLLLLEKT